MLEKVGFDIKEVRTANSGLRQVCLYEDAAVSKRKVTYEAIIIAR
jgi:hypothetical protein